MYQLMGFIFGNLFEILFISIMFYKIKGLKDKKLLLFIGTFITYFLSGFITSYSYNNQYLSYLILNVLTFVFLKFIYKEKINIIDLFVIYYIIMIINFSSLIPIVLFKYNFLSYLISRFLLLIFLLISSKLNNFYKFYCYNWNRHNDNKVKSITVRNITIISCNLMLYIINYFVLYYMNFI